VHVVFDSAMRDWIVTICQICHKDVNWLFVRTGDSRDRWSSSQPPPAEWLALSSLPHVCFGPIVRIVHGINCRSTAERRSAIRYFTQSTWVAKRIRTLPAERSELQSEGRCWLL